MHFHIRLLATAAAVIPFTPAAAQVQASEQPTIATGDTSVMVVKGGRERMIPFVDAYVVAVDREAGRITVDWEEDDA